MILLLILSSNIHRYELISVKPICAYAKKEFYIHINFNIGCLLQFLVVVLFYIFFLLPTT